MSLFGKNKSSNKVEPFIPSEKEFDLFQQRSGELITPKFRQSLQRAAAKLRALGKRPDTAPGFMDMIEGATGGFDTGFDRATTEALAGGVDPATSGAIRTAAGRPLDATFDAATAGAGTPAYADGFLGAVERAVNPDTRSTAFDTVRQNVIDRVAPEVNSTFAGSGMTGSGLHQLLLSKGIAKGLGEVEDDAFQRGEDRALDAAQIGQGAVERGRDFGLEAAAARQAAGERGADRTIGAEELIARLGEAAKDRSLAAAGARQGATESEAGRSLQSAALLEEAFGKDFARDLTTIEAERGIGSDFQDEKAGGLFSLLNASVGGAGSTSTSSRTPGVLDLLGTGAGIASLFSDERMKEDKRKVGNLDDGTPVYTYKMKGGAPDATGGKTQMGVMAQDLAKKKGKKKAVSRTLGGALMVDYGKI